MEQYRDDEMELDLRDLLFYLLRRWRSLLLCALALAALLGGLALFKGIRSLRDGEAVEKARAETAAAKEQYELSREVLERQIANLQREIETQESYKDSSILMGIDPYNEYRVSRVYYVSTDYQIMPGMSYQNPNRAAGILSAYMSIARNGEMIDYVLSRLDSELSIRNLKELIKVDVDSGNQLLTITTLGKNKELPESVMNYIVEDLRHNHQHVAETIGEHQIALVQESSGYTVDMELVNTLNQYEKNVTEMQNNLSKKQEALLALKEPADQSISRSGVLKKAVKHGLLGFLGGGFLAFLCLLCRYLFGGRLCAAGELRRRWGLNIIASLRRPRAKKGLLAGIDRLIDRLSGLTEENSDEELFYGIAAARIQGMSGGMAPVDLVGDLDGETLERVRAGLERKRGEAGISALGNIYGSEEAFTAFRSDRPVVILADAEKSKMSFLEQALEDAALMKKQLLGILLLR